PTLCERSEHQYQLGPRERLADADARASAEGEVRELRRSFFFPAGRIKTLGVSPEPRIALRDPGRDEDQRTHRQLVSADGIRHDVTPTDNPCGWIQPQDLGDDGTGVG